MCSRSLSNDNKLAVVVSPGSRLGRPAPAFTAFFMLFVLLPPASYAGECGPQGMLHATISSVETATEYIVHPDKSTSYCKLSLALITPRRVKGGDEKENLLVDGAMKGNILAATPDGIWCKITGQKETLLFSICYMKSDTSDENNNLARFLIKEGYAQTHFDNIDSFLSENAKTPASSATSDIPSTYITEQNDMLIKEYHRKGDPNTSRGEIISYIIPDAIEDHLTDEQVKLLNGAGFLLVGPAVLLIIQTAGRRGWQARTLRTTLCSLRDLKILRDGNGNSLDSKTLVATQIHDRPIRNSLMDIKDIENSLHALGSAAKDGEPAKVEIESIKGKVVDIKNAVEKIIEAKEKRVLKDDDVKKWAEDIQRNQGEIIGKIKEITDRSLVTKVFTGKA